MKRREKREEKGENEVKENIRGEKEEKINKRKHVDKNIEGKKQGWGAGAGRSRVFLAPWSRSRLKKNE